MARGSIRSYVKATQVQYWGFPDQSLENKALRKTRMQTAETPSQAILKKLGLHLLVELPHLVPYANCVALPKMPSHGETC